MCLPATVFFECVRSGCNGRRSSRGRGAGDDGIMMEPWGPTYLTPEQPNDFLRVAAASPRMPLDFIYHWPEAFDSKTGAENLLPYDSVVNPLTRPITLDRGWASSIPITLQPGETAVGGFGMGMDLRESRKRQTTVRLVDVGNGQNFEFQQESTFVCLNPLEVEPLPPSADEMFVRLRNPSGEAASLFVGNMYSEKKLPLEIKAGELEKIVRIPREPETAWGGTASASSELPSTKIINFPPSQPVGRT